VTSKHRISISLSKDDHLKLSSLSEKHRVSMAWLGRRAIEELLQELEDDDLQFPLIISRTQKKMREVPTLCLKK
jgi:hypothetical protein